MKQPRKIVRSILFFLLVIAFGASSYIALRPLLVRAQSNRAARSAADTFLQSYPDAVEAAEQPTTPDTAELPAGRAQRVAHSAETREATVAPEASVAQTASSMDATTGATSSMAKR